MRLNAVLMGIAVTFAALSPTIARADLVGSEVTAVWFYPNETNIYSGPLGPVAVTSGAPPEFPAGTLAFDGSLAISGTQIIWTATLPETYGTGTASPDDGAFNGSH